MERKLLFDSESWLDNIGNKDYYDSYLEWCEINNKTPHDMNSDKFMEWAIEDSWNTVSDEIANLKYSKEIEGMWCIYGTLGLWDGRHKIIPDFAKNIETAIQKCTPSSDYHIKATYDEKAIYLEIAHHDGTNNFTLRLLGEETEQMDKNDEDIEDIENESHFKALPEYLY